MDDVNLKLLQTELLHDEGVVLRIYPDQFGYATCGVGHLITKHDVEYGQPFGTKISERRARQLFDEDVKRTVETLFAKFPWVATQPAHVQRALANMAFQLGIAGLSSFRRTLAMVKAGKYDAACVNGLKSDWAKQTPARAQRVMALLRTPVESAL
jgi:lysozyme